MPRKSSGSSSKAKSPKVKVVEKSIFLSRPEAQALARGGKTQLRRPLFPQPPPQPDGSSYALVPAINEAYAAERKGLLFGPEIDKAPKDAHRVYVVGAVGYVRTQVGQTEWTCPVGKIGDRLWVKETWRTHVHADGVEGIVFTDEAFVPIADDAKARAAWKVLHENGIHGDRWRSAAFMPRWASRATIEITDLYADKIKALSEDDARAEGVVPTEDDLLNNPTVAHRLAFMHRWNNEYGDNSWDQNVYVWTVVFRVVTP